MVSQPAVHYRDKIPLSQVGSGDFQTMIDDRKGQLGSYKGSIKDKMFIQSTTELMEKVKYKRERVFKMSSGSKNILN
jgi:hypothetical protein